MKPICITPQRVDSLAQTLSSRKRAAIVVHTHPDGDAIGSGLGMLHFLKEARGMDARLIIPDAAPSTLDFLCKGEEIINAEESPKEASEALENCDLLVVQDMNAFSRAEALEPALKKSKAAKILIDHHLNPDEDAFDLVFSMNGISSASELLFWVLLELPEVDGKAENLPQKTRISLFTGMTTDTNNFANSVYPSTLEMASLLLQAGTDRDYILEEIYHRNREQMLKAQADMLLNHLVIRPDGLSYMIMTSEMFDSYGLLEGETEGLVNLPLSLDKVKVSILLKEAKGLGHYRVSIRAKKGWSANALATKHFHGGGHELAAGGKLFFPQDIADKTKAAAFLDGISAR